MTKSKTPPKAKAPEPKQEEEKNDGRRNRATTTPARVTVFLKGLEDGLTVKESLSIAGYSMAAHARLKLKSVKYREQIEVAEMQMTIKARAVVAKKIAADDLRAATWWLERKVPEEFRPQFGEDGQPLGLPPGSVVILPGDYPHPRIVPIPKNAKDS